MSTFNYLRKQALQLPRVEEGVHRGGPAFRVGGKAFALWWAEGQRTIMKLPPSHQHFLFEVNPEAFQPCKVGVGTWSFVELGLLKNAEVDKLVTEAWSTVVPKKLSKPILEKTFAQ